jgi:hypothetical protein
VSRNIVALVWLGGVVFAAVLYFAGPGPFISATLAALARAEWAIANGIAYLSAQTFDLVRAVAIALFACSWRSGFSPGTEASGGAAALLG